MTNWRRLLPWRRVARNRATPWQQACTTYAEIEEAVARARRPAYELRCHPIVVDQLREETLRPGPRPSCLGGLYDMLSCPVIIDPSMDCGQWEIRTDGIVVNSGNTERLWPR